MEAFGLRRRAEDGSVFLMGIWFGFLRKTVRGFGRRGSGHLFERDELSQREN